MILDYIELRYTQLPIKRVMDPVLLSLVFLVTLSSYIGYLLFTISLKITLIIITMSMMLIYAIKKTFDIYGVIIMGTVFNIVWPWIGIPFNFTVEDPEFYRWFLLTPSLTLGEAYMKSQINPVRSLEDALLPILDNPITFYFSGSMIVRYFGSLIRLFTNPQSIIRSTRVAEIHYDIGNDLYTDMTGKTRQYSCGFFPPGTTTLDEAQQLKIDLTLKKLNITREGMRLLEIGCGFGTLLATAKRDYKVQGTGLSLSVEQLKVCRDKYPDITFLEKDYRTYCIEIPEFSYDRVVSVGMFEHVGRKNYGVFFNLVRRSIVHNGVFVLHTIGSNQTNSAGNPWIDKYIFPGGELPSLAEICTAAEMYFRIEHVANFGRYYADTLECWKRNSVLFFEKVDRNGTEDQKATYNQEFRRMWNFYLVSCKIAFKLRRIHLYQLVLVPHSNRELIRHFGLNVQLQNDEDEDD